MVVVFEDQRNFVGPPKNIDKPSPSIANGSDAPQWLLDLQRDGYAVVKGVITKEKAAEYAKRAEDWLEGFNLGYKRNDPSTWDVKNLPRHNMGGLYSQYSFAHSQWVWDAKTEPKIMEVYEKVWGTKELTVSFDGGNLAVPLPEDQIDNKRRPWPHSDQSAYRPKRHCIQGLLNLLPNGPEDGGLMVVKGSANLFEEYVAAHQHLAPPEGWPTRDGFFYKSGDLQWYFDRGCQWVKPVMEPGDFVLWDSREVHYGAAPNGPNKRFAVYICYKPIAFLSEEQRQVKVAAFERGYCTTHDPTDFIVKEYQEAPWNIHFPYGKPVLSEAGKKAVGIIPY